MKNYILKSIVCLHALLYLTSCANPFYHQIATFSSEDAKIENDKYVAENDIIRIDYDFWAEYGCFRFVITNKTEKDVKIDLLRSFFIVNNIAEDYCDSKQCIYIPAKTSRVLGGNIISNSIFRDCGFARNPKSKEQAILQFHKDNSPIVLENKLLIIVDNKEIPISHIFYISELQNYLESDVVYYEYYCIDCSGIQVYDPKTIYLMMSPNKYYIEYQWSPVYSTDRL